MNTYDRIRSTLGEAASHAYERSIELLPEATMAVLVVGLGLIIGAGLYFLTMYILGYLAVDKLAAKTPLNRMLKSVGITKTVSEIVALLIFWLCVFVTLIFASEILNLEQVSDVLTVIILFIPQLIAALLIIVFGMLLAKFLAVLVEQTLGRAKVSYADSIAKIVYFAVLVLAFPLAFEQLGFDLSLITTNVMILLSALVLIVGIGTMISSRTLLENILACYQLRYQIRIGDRIAIGDTEGRVRGFTLTSVLIEVEGHDHVIPALQFFTSKYSLTHKDG